MSEGWPLLPGRASVEANIFDQKLTAHAKYARRRCARRMNNPEASSTPSKRKGAFGSSSTTANSSSQVGAVAGSDSTTRDSGGIKTLLTGTILERGAVVRASTILRDTPVAVVVCALMILCSILSTYLGDSFFALSPSSLVINSFRFWVVPEHFVAKELWV